jgi:hypothetical protein
LCFAVQQDVVVGFAIEDEEACGEEDGYNEDNPHVPSPACSLGDEATADRAKDGTKEDTHAAHRDSFPTLGRYEEISDDTGADSETGGATNASEEAHSDQAAEVWSQRAAECEGAEEDITGVKDYAATVDFRKWRKEEWSNLNRTSLVLST